MIITRAAPSDLDLLYEFRREAAVWLRSKGIDQWNNPFPADYLLASVNAGGVYLISDGDDVAATVTLDNQPEPDLWTDEELAEPDMHLHKLIVRRHYAGQGLGDRILDWACDHAARDHAAWVRINVTNDNTVLQRYYLDRGFHHIRSVEGGGVGNAGVAGWLAQREARRAAGCSLVEAR